MEKNYFVRGNNVVDSSGFGVPEANYEQQILLMPMIPFSMIMAATSASNFQVNEYTKSYLDFANAMVDNIACRNLTEEVDRFLLIRTEQLKSSLQQQWKQYSASIAMNLEAKSHTLLMQKDKDLVEEKEKVMKLISLLKKALLEKEKWEKIARKLNGTVSILRQTLEKVEKPCFSSTGGINAEEEVASSWFCSPEEEEANHGEPSLKRKRGHSHGSIFLCRICSLSSACVLILPCRHLCLCKHCEALQYFWCPVCKCVKNETIEVLY